MLLQGAPSVVRDVHVLPLQPHSGERHTLAGEGKNGVKASTLGSGEDSDPPKPPEPKRPGP